MCRPGGKRCPGESSPEHIAWRNAKRRERYAAQKLSSQSGASNVTSVLEKSDEEYSGVNSEERKVLSELASLLEENGESIDHQYSGDGSLGIEYTDGDEKKFLGNIEVAGGGLLMGVSVSQDEDGEIQEDIEAIHYSMITDAKSINIDDVKKGLNKKEDMTDMYQQIAYSLPSHKVNNPLDVEEQKDFTMTFFTGGTVYEFKPTEKFEGGIKGLVLSEDHEKVENPQEESFPINKLMGINFISHSEDEEDPERISQEAKDAIRLLSAAGGSSNKVKKPSRDFSDWTLNDRSGEDLYKQGEVPVGFYPEVGVKVYENTGDLAERGYFAKHTIRGTIDPEGIKEGDDTEVFGFPEIRNNKYKLKSKTEVELESYSSSDSEFNQLAKNETKGFSSETKQITKEYTRSMYRGLNRILHYGEDRLDLEGDGGIGDTGDIQDIGSHFSFYKEYRTPGNFKKMYNGVMRAFKESPKVPRYTTRGQGKAASVITKAGGVDNYVEKNFQVGSTFQFDTFQSSSPSVNTASDYLEEDGILFEKYTPEGINVEDITVYKGEKEILLPAGQKYMTVGVHKNVTVEAKGVKRKGVTVIRQVAVNSKGEILDGTNSDKQKTLPYQDRWRKVFGK